MPSSAFNPRATLEKYAKLYNQYSQKYNRIVLLYELGKFYEIMGVENEHETIGNVSQICKDVGLTKTRYNKKKPKNSRENPLKAGFPSPSLENYIPKFLDQHYTIIVYSQYDDGKKKTRNLDRIVSPGTYLNENMATDTTSNLVSLYIEGDKTLEINITTIDISTGKCVAYYIGDIRDEAIKKASRILHTSYPPSEIILCEQACSSNQEHSSIIKELELEHIIIHRHTLNKIMLRQSYQNEFLKKIFPQCGMLSPIEYLNMENYPSLIVSFLILLNFANEHDDHILEKISKPQIKQMQQYLYLTHRTIAQLNLVSTNDIKDKSLFAILNKTNTAMGKRLFKQRLLSPLISPKILQERYNQIEELQKPFLERGVSFGDVYEDYLKNIIDLDRFHRRIFLKKLHPFEFEALDTSYSSILKIIKLDPKIFKNYINDATIQQFKKFMLFYRYHLNLDTIGQYSQTNVGSPIFKQSLFSDIDELYVKLDNTWNKFNSLAKELSQYIDDNEDIVKIERTGIEGYYLSTTTKRYKSFLEQHKKYKFTIKQQKTYVKIFSPTIREYSKTILSYTEEIISLNRIKFLELLEQLSNKYQICLKNISNYVAHIDAVTSCAKVAWLYNYCKPTIVKCGDKSYIEATDMRHPISERINEDDDFVANDISLGKDINGMLLYGINGSGKSLYLKSIGLCVILAQAGFYVPCRSFTYFPFQNLMTKISMNDDLYRNQSTFTCEMNDLRAMLEKANSQTLILADELCSGTETNSAISIVASSIKSLADMNTNFVFTTHLHQLTTINIINLSNVKFFHLSIDIVSGEIIYGRKLQEGSGNSSYGIEIAKQLKVGDSSFIKNAIAVRRTLENLTKTSEVPKGPLSVGVLTTKQSRYNKDLYMDQCQQCGSTKNLHTHHIKHQASANKNGMIDGHHKNKKSNLMILCQDCHQRMHLAQ